jgi:penicillin V acylase-like amidase (Ntn superfamily)
MRKMPTAKPHDLDKSLVNTRLPHGMWPRKNNMRCFTRTLVRTGSLAVTIALLWLGVAPAAIACTTFCLLSEGRIVLGKNYDWYVVAGSLIVNKRNTERFAYPLNDSGAKWISKYGSVTFNQYGRDAPSGGINEAGLVVEILWMTGTTYPAPDHRPAVDGSGWAQYQLDTARSVDEVLASDATVRITRTAGRLHYLVADRAGQVAVVEFRDGQRLTYTGSMLPAAVLANDFYAGALERSSQLDRAGQPGDRFAQAARKSRAYDVKAHGDPVSYAFATLAQVAQKPAQGTLGAPAVSGAAHITQWSIVYEIDVGRLHFRSPTAASIKSLSLADVDFSCTTPVLVLDVHESEGGDVGGRLHPYTREANLKLIRGSYSQTSFLRGLSEQELEQIATRPERGVCVAAVR